ncbi:uncharacterized protein LOC130385575 [Gadus chalcogrammus]|uniref:uncharacterized protein LOC130385575 n=1 Tax=Gadus chalcogrammus TaxID=1042646 RepID=UPI0024C2AD06|nr:uncharacterized protein LOC130385575 [Gadus chalcogrammus]
MAAWTVRDFAHSTVRTRQWTMTQKIMSIVNLDKRETNRNSVAMEKEGFIRTIDALRKDVEVQEVCTDGHLGIKALFSKGMYKDIGVVHCLDIWHGSKNLSKKIVAAGQQKSCSILLQWDRDICNHFWYCCKIAGTYYEFFDMWVGLLHHVTGEHEWALGACRHGPLVDSREKDWIVKNSPAQQKLREIIMDIRWLKNVHLYLPFRSTAELESFHNHILMYASKRHSFSPQGYKARTLLAGLDYNHHLHRPAKRRQDGSIQASSCSEGRLLQGGWHGPDPQDQKIHAGWESYLVSLPQVLRNSCRSKSAEA